MLSGYSVAVDNGFTKIVVNTMIGSDGTERMCSNCVL